METVCSSRNKEIVMMWPAIPVRIPLLFLPGMAVFAQGAENELPLARWSFDAGADRWTSGNQCSVEVAGGELHVTATGAEANFYSSSYPKTHPMRNCSGCNGLSPSDSGVFVRYRAMSLTFHPSRRKLRSSVDREWPYVISFSTFSGGPRCTQ